MSLPAVMSRLHRKKQQRDLSVDIIIGNDKKHELVELIENCMNQKKMQTKKPERVDDWKENICDINEKAEHMKHCLSAGRKNIPELFKGAGWLQPVLHILYYSICER